jgi:amino acid permease
MKATSYISSLSSISVVVAVILVMADVGRNKPIQTQMPKATLNLAGTARFTTIITAVLNIVSSYTGHVAYLSLASELASPAYFKRALYVQMTIATALYCIVGITIYCFVGNRVASPALSSASPAISKAAYGIASLTIVLAGVVNAHVLCKYYYHRYFEQIMRERSARAYGSWVAIVSISWFTAWVLAEAIPSFKHMLAFVSALFSTWFSFGVPAWMWFYMNRGNILDSGTRMRLLAVFAGVVLVFSTGLSIVGLYATIKEMVDGFSGKSFSCHIAKTE